MATLALGAALASAGCGPAGVGGSLTPKSQARGAAGVAAKAADALAGAIARADRATFARHDADSDGALSPTELPGLPTDGFRALDQDADGRLTPAEAVAQAGATDRRARAAAAMARAARLEAGVDEAAEGAIAGKPLTAAELAAFATRLGDAPTSDGLASGGRPVVLVPGYLDASWYLNAVKGRVHGLKRSAHTLQLFPNVCDIRVSAQRLRAFVDQVKASTGYDQVDLVAHSEGGLISRYYIKYLGGDAAVGRMVSLAVPHHGTILGFIGPGMGADQMQPGSAFINDLNAGDESWGDVAYTSIRGGLDEIIIPHRSMIQEGADNRFVPWVEHATILTSKAVWRHIQDGLAK